MRYRSCNNPYRYSDCDYGRGYGYGYSPYRNYFNCDEQYYGYDRPYSYDYGPYRNRYW